ncbi:lytic transglycosylase [Shewanella gelidii]|uniref:Lytic transglycosylase n=2 Tax=Shewanella gelidii TaxID=1642821 RepID=A0A917N842_9GAMM|nr:lytic transglycosylase [Shewanella gelidii]
MKQIIAVIPLMFSAGLMSFSASAAEQDFSQCKVKLEKAAVAQGIQQSTIEKGLRDLKPIKRVIKLDRSQPEFSQTFADYFNKRVTSKRVAQGRKLLKKHRALLQKLQKEYGVPPQYLMSFWGLETNFGGYKGKMPVLDALATLACDPRRDSFFTQEFILALGLMEKNGFEPQQMVGSWAGAMGHTQFMPSAYSQYAVDGDGDGIVDLWNSTEDALTSAANFLAELGWQRNERWGREVLLPSDYNFKYLGAKDRLPLSQWAEAGVRQANGQAISTPKMDAALYVPAGQAGPAFLAYENFNVIMRWNRSENYAIAVGHLADRINGAAPLQKKPPLQTRLSRAQIKALQQSLIDLGYELGKADGIMGKQSIAALQQYQRSQGMIADGYPSEDSFKALSIKL